ncbi:hypothetical protein K458DRAFT_416227 [Lentithecium fluviatile CBS 122367]|uniref:RING-type domain-containing protein n=1 Tax=Lentithecium fluviatile CBS 122367 TaxID=1168545 RepID=A0A6G1J9K6_9PLEO|nr:hypothetical protein K458DRAFT_416227 [Lentithecium fluviatile CBS 122367]
MSAPNWQPYGDPFHAPAANINHHSNRDRPELFGYDINAFHPVQFQSQSQSQSQSQPGSHQQSPEPLDESFFYNAFHASPSPPNPSFLDNILNPLESQFNNSLRYRVHDSPPRRRQPSPIVSIQSSMPSARRIERPARLPNGYVDLTGMSESPEEPRRRRQSPASGPSAKRRKHNDGTSVKEANDTPEATVEEIDLSDDRRTVQDVLQKQREEAIKAQEKPEEKATTFNTITCVICMDTPTDLTATACGHLFCHTCLMEALIAGENRAAPGEPKRSQCPVCRKFINRTKASDIIPLLLKKGLATQPRKSGSVAAATSKVTS